MSKTVHYVGPSGEGVELVVPLKDGSNTGITVKHGEAVPTKVGNLDVDPKFFDTLLEQEGNWSTTTATKKGDN